MSWLLKITFEEEQNLTEKQSTSEMKSPWQESPTQFCFPASSFCYKPYPDHQGKTIRNHKLLEPFHSGILMILIKEINLTPSSMMLLQS